MKSDIAVKTKKSSAYKWRNTPNEQGEASSFALDFDDQDKYIDSIAKVNVFDLEKDAINLGAWLLLHHPNFFDGSWKGHARYFFWLLNTLVITGIQILLVNNYLID